MCDYNVSRKRPHAPGAGECSRAAEYCIDGVDSRAARWHLHLCWQHVEMVLRVVKLAPYERERKRVGSERKNTYTNPVVAAEWEKRNHWFFSYERGPRLPYRAIKECVSSEPRGVKQVRVRGA
jgi:hypothetical protein